MHIYLSCGQFTLTILIPLIGTIQPYLIVADYDYTNSEANLHFLSLDGKRMATPISRVVYFFFSMDYHYRCDHTNSQYYLYSHKYLYCTSLCSNNRLYWVNNYYSVWSSMLDGTRDSPLYTFQTRK